MRLDKYDVWLPFMSITKGLWYQRWRQPYYTHSSKIRWRVVNTRKFYLRKRYWCHVWTPRWHKGRGVYITIGLGWYAIYRGY